MLFMGVGKTIQYLPKEVEGILLTVASLKAKTLKIWCKQTLP